GEEVGLADVQCGKSGEGASRLDLLEGVPGGERADPADGGLAGARAAGVEKAGFVRVDGRPGAVGVAPGLLDGEGIRRRVRLGGAEVFGEDDGGGRGRGAQHAGAEEDRGSPERIARDRSAADGAVAERTFCGRRVVHVVSWVRGRV